MWFEIKCKNKLIHGPDNALLNIQIIRKFAPPKVHEIVKPVVERGSWHAHSENILYSLLCSPIKKNRTFAVKQILKIRGNSDVGNSAGRTFKVPKIKWNASNLHELIDWSDEIYEPIITY